MGKGMLRFLWLQLIQIVYFIVMDSNKIGGQMYMEDECSALFKLKLNLKLDYRYYSEVESWNSSADCCSWIGVTCKNSHVIAVDLEDKYIIGGLDNSSSLFYLQHLKKLNLAMNHFSAPIPEALGRLINLEYLNLYSAGFVGQIPTVIGRMKKLRRLDLSYNKLYLGPFALELHIRGLSSLENLRLDTLDLSGNSLNFIGSLNQLSTLSLARCNLTGGFPQWIENLTMLEYLDLSNNILTGPLPHLSNLRNLRYIDLSENFLTGALPSSLFALPSLHLISLFKNQFSETLPNAYSSTLNSIDLNCNMLNGSVPMSLYNLQNLGFLDLSFNNFNGTVELTDLMRLQNLQSLTLSYSGLSISTGNSNLSWFPHGIYTLSLASCNLTIFPNLVNRTELGDLDLSNNHLQGVIPSWIWDVWGGVNLSYNLLETFESLRIENSNVTYIELHHNMLTGQLPFFPQQAWYVDYSFNRFSSTIPNIGENLVVLNLSNNKLKGDVPGNISRGCSLLTLDLSHNTLEGEVPITLANCTSLVVVNLGNNRIQDRFPCWLKRLPNLLVLVLKSNEFHGPLNCPNSTNWNLWQSLHIIDLSNNNFMGDLPSSFFPDWKAMTKANAPEKLSSGSSIDITSVLILARALRIEIAQYVVTIAMSGQELKPDYIWNVFSAIDLSSNMFSGEIPAEIGRLDALHGLNLSHNALTGPIPSTFGNMRELQWLDLSHNSLNGTIPGELATLNSLATLNLSFNRLEGVIPRGPQFQTFPATAFVGNKGLCGFPSNVSCRHAPDSPKVAGRSSHAGSSVKWDFMVGAEVGLIVGLAIVIGPLLLYEQWSRYYFMHLDNILRNVFGIRQRPARRPIRSL